MYYQIYINVEIKKLISERDYKGIYKKAINEKMKNVVGIDIKINKPKNNTIEIDNSKSIRNINNIIKLIIKKLKL